MNDSDAGQTEQDSGTTSPSDTGTEGTADTGPEPTTDTGQPPSDMAEQPQDGGSPLDQGTTSDGGTTDMGTAADAGDMGSFCGDGVCDADESVLTCAADCSDNTVPECSDGADNDGDGAIDFRPGPNMGDPECDGPTDDDESM